MSYVFSTQTLGQTKATVSGAATDSGIMEHNLSNINATLASADSVMSAMNDLYGIVGMTVTDLTRTVKQDVDNND